MIITQIDAIDIPDAWFQSLYHILDYGGKYKNELGSFEGETRLEFDFAIINIKHAYNSNYDEMRPKMPPQMTLPDPIEPGYIEQYVPYIMSDHKEPNEEYTYGSRMADQIEYWINQLTKTPKTNQAVLQVAQPDDYKLPDPPCLRHIDMRVADNKLHFYPYFRSWDLWGGFPANLAGIAVLQEYMASSIGGLEPGNIVASSKGLHIYGYVEELAKIRTNKGR